MGTVFYSWQADTNQDANRYFIREVLKMAVKLVNKKNGSEVVTLDMDTKDRLGFIDINKVIMEKIEHCDVFVADITSIGRVGKKASPNPNVLLELGFALGCIGDQKIIAFLNETYEQIENYPFDLKTRRPLIYSLSEADIIADKDVLKKTATKIAVSVADIIREMIKLDKPKIHTVEEKITRERDILKLQRLLDHIPVTYIHKIIEIGRESLSIDTDYISIYYDVVGVVDFAYFQMYDSKLQELIDQFSNALGAVFSHGHEFHHIHHTICRPLKPSESLVNTFIAEINELERSFKNLTEYVFANYKEIDLEETNRKAFDGYKHRKKEIEELYATEDE